MFVYIIPLTALLLSFMALLASMRFIFSRQGLYWLFPAIISLLLFFQNLDTLLLLGEEDITEFAYTFRNFAPFVLAAKTFVDGLPLQLFTTLPIQQLALLGGMLVLDLLSMLFFFSDIYAVGTKARFILLFNIGILILSAATLCGPAADRGAMAILAVPSAILLPFMMVRTHRPVSFIFYLLLLLSATLGVLLQ